MSVLAREYLEDIVDQQRLIIPSELFGGHNPAILIARVSPSTKHHNNQVVRVMSFIDYLTPGAASDLGSITVAGTDVPRAQEIAAAWLGAQPEVRVVATAGYATYAELFVVEQIT